MLALFLGLWMALAPPQAPDMTGYYELEFSMGAAGLEVTRQEDGTYRGLFHAASGDAPPVGARSVTVKDSTIDAVVVVHGMAMRMHLEVEGTKVQGSYTMDESDPTPITGRRLEKRPPPGR